MSACRFEPQVIEAAQREEWSSALSEHVSGCDDCIAAVAVAPWMSRFAKLDDREHSLPDASIIYLKARLMQGRADALRISRPMDAAQLLAYLVVAGGWAGVLTWKWNALALWLRGFTPTTMILHQTARGESLSMSLFAILLLLVSVTVMLALHTIMAEE
jgi:hypothetical protein